MPDQTAVTIGATASAKAVSLASEVVAAGGTALETALAANGGIATTILVPLAVEAAEELEQMIAQARQQEVRGHKLIQQLHTYH